MAKVKLIRVSDTTYHGLRAKYPKAFMIHRCRGGFEGYIEEQEDETNVSSSD